MALPTHRLSIFKRWGNEAWSNDWLLNVIDMDAGADVADAIIEFERQLHTVDISFEYYRLSTMTEGDRVFRHVPINLPGISFTVDLAGLPLFNTVRMDMSTLDSDPCRKYFRLPLGEVNQENGKIGAAALTAYNGKITTYLANTIALDNIVSGKGNVVTGGTIYPYVQMRQLHRRRRRVDP